MALQECNIKNLVLDLDGTLFKWDPQSAGIGSLINPKLFMHMLEDSIWNEYETGKISCDEPFQLLSKKYGVPAESIQAAANAAMENISPVSEILNIVAEYGGKLRLFCMANFPAPQIEFLLKRYSKLWGKFEKVFTSADAGMRKPNLNFFKFVMQEAEINPKETVFVDSLVVNCVAAKSLGFVTVLYEHTESAIQQLNTALRTEDERLSLARMYLNGVLEYNQQDLDTVSNKGPRLEDNFSEFYIAEVLEDERFLPDIPIPDNLELLYTRESDMHKWILFPLPNDLDTTSVGMSVWYKHKKVTHEYINQVVDHMHDYGSEEGILQTYFDRSRPRICHGVLANITMLFHVAGRPLPEGTREFLYNILVNRAYLDGSQYYIGPAPFLYFISRTARGFRDSHSLPKDFISVLTDRVREQMGTQSDPLAVAMIILAAVNLQLDPDVRDVETLRRSQKVDGSWDMCYWFKGNVLKFGCKALTSAFAFSALQRARERRTGIAETDPAKATSVLYRSGSLPLAMV